jgi:sugar O-acyltransferase (sialic acid O-acetyltransferase NeuD family)
MIVAIYGCGQNGLQAFHCLRHQPDVEVMGFLDDDPSRHGCTYLGRPVLGGLADVPELLEKGLRGAVVAIGDCAARRTLTSSLTALGLEMVSAIHPRALIESPRSIGGGAIIEMGAAIHPEAEIGKGVFLGGGATVAHHSVVGDFSLIAGGVVFGGHVTVGSETLIGVGVSIKPHITIGSRVIVGVGAAVIVHLPDDVVAVGVPARIVSRNRGNS